MTTDTATNFLGIPIEGDITHGEPKANQLPLSDLTPIIQAVLDDENVAIFGWTQYTPYFNDGEPCVFSVYGLWAYPSTAALEEAEESYGYREENVEYGTVWGEIPWSWSGPWPNREKIYGEYTGDYPETYPKLIRLVEALASDQFDDALLTLFGDHAQVTVTREKIEIEHYSHE